MYFDEFSFPEVYSSLPNYFALYENSFLNMSQSTAFTMSTTFSESIPLIPKQFSNWEKEIYGSKEHPLIIDDIEENQLMNFKQEIKNELIIIPQKEIEKKESLVEQLIKNPTEEEKQKKKSTKKNKKANNLSEEILEKQDETSILPKKEIEKKPRKPKAIKVANENLETSNQNPTEEKKETKKTRKINSKKSDKLKLVEIEQLTHLIPAPIDQVDQADKLADDKSKVSEKKEVKAVEKKPRNKVPKVIKSQLDQNNTESNPEKKAIKKYEKKIKQPQDLTKLKLKSVTKRVKKELPERVIINGSLGSGVFPKTSVQLACWNINGIRSVINKQAIHSFLREYDVICLNETKIDEEAFQKEGLYHQLKSINSQYEQYYSFCSVKKGYSGVAIFSKEKAISVKQGIDVNEFDVEGRVLTAEFDQFIVMTVYVPNNNQDKIGRTQYRNNFDRKFKEYVTKLQNNHPDKPVIICGDINVAHEDIDIKYLRESYGKPGITQMERNNFDSLLKSGWIDSFRYKNPTARKYTSGQKLFCPPFYFLEWRFDYFLINQKFIKQCLFSDIDSNTKGSDHQPVRFILRIAQSKQNEGINFQNEVLKNRSEAVVVNDLQQGGVLA